MSDRLVGELHRVLIETLRRVRPDAFERPVTVAEIYQDLVPYRVARSLGFELNADYEFALLRLLAGEGGLARIEPEEVQAELRDELASPNPNVGLFRNYAACDVWLSPPRLSGERPSQSEDSQTDRQPPTARIEPPAVDQQPERKHQPSVQPSQKTTSTSISVDQDACVSCGGELPAGKMVNFCPFCGHDQTRRPCPSCGEMLDPLWRFCIVCGARVGSFEDHVN